MLRFIKLYSLDNSFQEVSFKDGINLICGEKSINVEGVVESDKQNGVGKSLVIELINFCLLKRDSESRVTEIPEEHLSPDSFVYLHFQLYGKDYIIGRNKKNEIKIKFSDSEFKSYEFGVASKELTRILSFKDPLLSARDYFNFIIKEEDYSYREFIKLYKSSYADLLKIHFYFFAIPIKALNVIKNSLKKNQEATAAIRNIIKDLEKKNLNFDEIKALQNQIKSEIQKAEQAIDYNEITDEIKKEAELLSIKEEELNGVILRKKNLQIQLIEIDNFASNYNEDFYIDDSEIKDVFEKFKSGLGEFIVKDLSELKKFRDQVIEFKSQLLLQKRKRLAEEIEKLDQNITELKNIIIEKHGNLTSKKSSNFSKGLIIYKKKYAELQKYSSFIDEHERREKEKYESRKDFNEEIDLLKKIEAEVKQIKTSFQENFVKIHNEIMGNSQASFDFEFKPKFSPEGFFEFNPQVHGQGSKGVNQMRAVIYDLALLLNANTNSRHLKSIIHDNLIFGSVDKDSSINTLNFISQFDEHAFQYIATVNKDDFNYSELEEKFTFDTKKQVIIELTKAKPLFPDWK